MNATCAATERPILFSGSMVRAILEGRKTQTRRVVKPQPYFVSCQQQPDPAVQAIADAAMRKLHSGGEGCPYGKPGDRIWVRETFCPVHHGSYEPISGKARKFECLIEYAAADHSGYHAAWDHFKGKWRPSIFMPRWASRITLEITELRVERLQDISEGAAVAEGIERVISLGAYNTFRNYSDSAATHVFARHSFQTLWDSINSKRGFGWDSNPWVWVISFTKVQ